MYNTDLVSLSQINTYFLPKIAREYNITDESGNRKSQINNEQPRWSSPFISTSGWGSSVFSNNRIDVHSNEESQESKESKKKKKEERSPNYLQLVLIGSVTALATAFGLGRLRSSITAAEQNIWYSRNVVANPSVWDRTLDLATRSNILTVSNTYFRAEMDRKSKLSNYQNSLVGIAIGTGIGIIGVVSSIEFLPIIGIVTAVASATFGVYHAAIHWDDFTRTQDEFKNLNLVNLIHQSTVPPQPTAPPAPGWNIPFTSKH